MSNPLGQLDGKKQEKEFRDFELFRNKLNKESWNTNGKQQQEKSAT